MSLLVSETATAFDTTAIAVGDFIRLEYTGDADDTVNGIVAAVTPGAVTIAHIPVVTSRRVNYYVLRVSELENWNVKWSRDLETIYTYSADDSTDVDTEGAEE